MRVLAICLLLVAVRSTNPGVRIVVDTATLNQAVSKGVAALEAALPLSAGDFEFSKKLLGIETELAVTNLTVQSVTVDPLQTAVTLESPNFVSFRTAVSAEVTLGVALKFGIIHRRLTVAVRLTQAQVEASIVLNSSGDAMMQLEAGKFSLKVADLSFAISDPLIAVIVDLIKDLSWDFIPRIGGILFSTGVHTINSLLATSPLRLPFAGFLLDLNLQGVPVVVSDNFLSIPLNGTLLAASESYPLTGPSETPIINANGLPVQFFLTDYTLQSAVAAIWPLVQLELNAFPEPFQIITGFFMDTESFRILIPELYTRYGQAPLLLSVSSVPEAVPEVQLTMGLQTTLTLNVTLSVQQAGQWQPACSLQAAVALDVSLLSEQLNYYLQFNSLSMTQLTQTGGAAIDVANTQASFSEILTLYFADINGLFHNTMRLTFIGVPGLHVNAVELIQSAGYLQPGWQIRLT